jgi:hypothetical protein
MWISLYTCEVHYAKDERHRGQIKRTKWNGVSHSKVVKLEVI